MSLPSGLPACLQLPPFARDDICQLACLSADLLVAELVDPCHALAPELTSAALQLLQQLADCLDRAAPHWEQATRGPAAEELGTHLAWLLDAAHRCLCCLRRADPSTAQVRAQEQLAPRRLPPSKPLSLSSRAAGKPRGAPGAWRVP